MNGFLSSEYNTVKEQEKLKAGISEIREVTYDQIRETVILMIEANGGIEGLEKNKNKGKIYYDMQIMLDAVLHKVLKLVYPEEDVNKDIGDEFVHPMGKNSYYYSKIKGDLFSDISDNHVTIRDVSEKYSNQFRIFYELLEMKVLNVLNLIGADAKKDFLTYLVKDYKELILHRENTKLFDTILESIIIPENMGDGDPSLN